MIAPDTPPVAAEMIAASAVETKSALPSPQPPRSPMIAFTSLDSPHSAAKMMTRPMPMSSVFFAPIRLDTQLVKNMQIPVMNR